MKSVALLVSALLSYFLVNPEVVAKTPETLSYAGRAGTDATIVGKSGIGTSNAIIKIKITRENAAEFCNVQLQDTSERCIRETQREYGSQIKSTVSGNCRKRTWIDMFGDSYVLRGWRKDFNLGDDVAVDVDFVIQRTATGEILGGSMASGYWVEINIFEALCPNFRKSLPRRKAERIYQIEKATNENSLGKRVSTLMPQEKTTTLK